MKNTHDYMESFLPCGIGETTEELIYTLANRKSARCSQKKNTESYQRYCSSISDAQERVKSTQWLLKACCQDH